MILEGSLLPVLHADPLAIHKPFSLVRISKSPASTFSKLKWEVLGSLLFWQPLWWTPSIFSKMFFSSLFLSEASFSVPSEEILCCANSAALPSPTIWATASVPARFPFSWPPPIRKGEKGDPERTNRAPIPLGAWNLWPDIDKKSIASITEKKVIEIEKKLRSKYGNNEKEFWTNLRDVYI